MTRESHPVGIEMPGVRDAGDFAALELTRGCEKMDSSLGVNRYNMV